MCGLRSPPAGEGASPYRYDAGATSTTPTFNPRTSSLVAARVIQSISWSPSTSMAAGRAAKAGTAERAASAPAGRLIQDFRRGGDDWRRASPYAEPATGKAYSGGTSIEEVFERGDDRLVRHRIYGPNGDVLHETFRPYAKFGAP